MNAAVSPLAGSTPETAAPGVGVGLAEGVGVETEPLPFPSHADNANISAILAPVAHSFFISPLPLMVRLS
ncbi:hypothetical protein D3C86_2173260 [compost metagenome]